MVIMNKIFFSIIIPTYNQGKFLEKCIKSCLDQTYKNYEIIVIDNNSTDITFDVLKKYENKIIYKRIDNDGVISKSRNVALNISRGNWIALLDSDDYFFKNKLEEAKNTIQRNNFDVFSNSEWISDKLGNSNKIWFYGNKEKNFYLDLIKFGNSISTSSSIIKKDFLNQNLINFNEDKEIRNIADYDFFLSIAKKKGKFFFYNKPLGFHLMHQESTSFKSKNTHLITLKKLLNNHLKSRDINEKEFNFSLFNLLIIDMIGDKDIKLFKKLIELCKIFLTSPVRTTFIIFRILNKYIKSIILNLIYKKYLS